MVKRGLIATADAANKGPMPAAKYGKGTNASPAATFSLGSDFSGLDTPVIACRRLGLSFNHVFSSDVSPAAKKIIEHTHRPANYYEDVTLRNHQTTPRCDVYCTGFPCQAFSSLGNQEGLQDKKGRGLLMFSSLEYIKAQAPKVVVAENVETLATRFKKLAELFVRSLKELGYSVEEGILNTEDYGVPQSRRRWYCVGILQSCVRQRLALATVFPEPLKYKIPLEKIIKVLPPSEWRKAPREKEVLALKNVKNAYAKLVTKDPVVNPFMVPVIIDTGSSEAFSTHRVKGCMCITRTRAAQGGYWCSTKGGYLTPDELGMLQGFRPEDVDWRSAGVSPHAWGGCVGNAMSLCVVLCLLPGVLYQSKIINKESLDQLRNLVEHPGFVLEPLNK